MSLSPEQTNSSHLAVPTWGDPNRSPTPTSPLSRADSPLSNLYEGDVSAVGSLDDEATSPKHDETHEKESYSPTAQSTSGLDHGSDKADMAVKQSDVPESLTASIQKLDELKDDTTLYPESKEAIQTFKDGLKGLKSEKNLTYGTQRETWQLQLDFQDKLDEISEPRSTELKNMFRVVPLESLEAFKSWVR